MTDPVFSIAFTGFFAATMFAAGWLSGVRFGGGDWWARNRNRSLEDIWTDWRHKP